MPAIRIRHAAIRSVPACIATACTWRRGIRHCPWIGRRWIRPWPSRVSTKINGPFFNGVRPTPGQSLGLFLGTGNQDDYIKLVLEDERGLSLVSETAGSVEEVAYPDAGEGLLAASSITLFLTVDPLAGSVQPAYLVEGGQRALLGAPLLLSDAVLEAVRGNAVIGSHPVGLAVGLIATSPEATQFGASWDYLKITLGE